MQTTSLASSSTTTTSSNAFGLPIITPGHPGDAMSAINDIYDVHRAMEFLFESPSSNERNTNTLASCSSDSDVMRTPLGGDSPASVQLSNRGPYLPAACKGASAPDSQHATSAVARACTGVTCTTTTLTDHRASSSRSSSVQAHTYCSYLCDTRPLRIVLRRNSPAAVSVHAHTQYSVQPTVTSCQTFLQRLAATSTYVANYLATSANYARNSPAFASRKRKPRRKPRRRAVGVSDDDSGDTWRAKKKKKKSSGGSSRHSNSGSRQSRKLSLSSSNSVTSLQTGVSSAHSSTTPAQQTQEEVEESTTSTQQSVWGTSAPDWLLVRVFSTLAEMEGGAVPSLVHACRVCTLWNRIVSHTPSLWTVVDLNSHLVPECYRNVKTLLWLVDYRLAHTEELVLANWNNAIGPASVTLLCERCPCLRSLSLSSCHALTCEQLQELVTSLPLLSHLDLADVQPIIHTSHSISSDKCSPRPTHLSPYRSSAASPGSHAPVYSQSRHLPVTVFAINQLMPAISQRLRSLTLSHNCVIGLSVIVEIISANCCNLELLDISNMSSPSRDAVPVCIEKLQCGCPLLRVLRWTNTHIKLADTPIKEQVQSCGFAHLEELSIAVVRGSQWGIDDAGLERLLKNSARLLLLDVRGCERLTSAALVRVPAWNLQQLYFSDTAASSPRDSSLCASRLELVLRRWAHSLRELDLSGYASQHDLDTALIALLGGGEHLRRLQLVGAALSFRPLARIVLTCTQLEHLDLTACRALPRGIKRPYRGAKQLADLRAMIQQNRFGDEW